MVDPFSITLGAGQIASGCIQCTVQIVKFVGDVKNCDSRIRAFYDEVVALSATYEGLSKSLETPIMLEAARVASKAQDGAHLWDQVRIALDDSLRTVNRINRVLDDVSRKTGFGRRIKTVLEESLREGELQRLRQRVQFFNHTISMPIQMMCLMLQLEQRGMSTEHQRLLEEKFMSLERTMRQLVAHPDRVSMISGSTLLVGTADENTDARGKETYLSFAKKILHTASTAASIRSSLSTISPQIDPPQLIELGGSPPMAYQQQQLPARNRSIPDWIPQPNTALPGDLLPQIDRAASLTSIPPEMPKQPSKAAEVAYKLAQQHLRLGHDKTEKGEHESAEKSFRKALQLLEKHNFEGRIAFQPAEVVLMLAHSCLMQQNYDEAVELLNPVAERDSNIFPRSGASRTAENSATSQLAEPVDKLQALAANQMLGEVYKQRGDFELAKEHALTAFMERTDELGEADEKTLESARLLIDIFRVMGDEEEAEAYEVFLVPAKTKNTDDQMRSRDSGVVLSSDEHTIGAPSISPPPSEIIVSSPTQDRRQPRQSFTARLKNIGRPSQPNLAQPTSEPHRKSFSRTTTFDNNSNEPDAFAVRHSALLSSPSDTSHGRSNSYVNDGSTPTPSPQLERTASIKLLEPNFQAVAQLCQAGDFKKATKIACRFLENYESSAFIIRRDELERNIKKGRGVGLASTGEGYSPLHYFCELREECLDEVALIIKYGVDVNATCYKAGYTSSKPEAILTPLHLAIARGHTQIAKLLLEQPDIRVDFKDSDGFFPLMAAARRKQYEIVRLCLDHSAKALPKEYPHNWHGCSPLHDAAKHCDLSLVEMYLSRRDQFRDVFNVNLQDRFGKTALMHAVIKTDISNLTDRIRMMKGRKEVVEALLEAGADTQVLDDSGRSARWYAEREQGSDREAIMEMVGETRFEMA